MRARRETVIASLLILMLAVPNLAAAQQPPPRPGCFVGVMGQVGRPGVYEYPHAPRLDEALWYARQLTPAASGNLRIIREGQAGQKTFYSPGADFVLFPGDIVIAETLRTGPLRPTAPTPQQAAAQAPLQIGCVNLLTNRPVVLPVPRQHATVGQVAAYLGQSPQAVSRIIQTGAEQVPGADLANQPLPDGAVLVFDPALVRIERVPDLDNTFRISPQAPPATKPQPYQRQSGTNEPHALPTDGQPAPTAPPVSHIAAAATAETAMPPVEGAAVSPTDGLDPRVLVRSSGASLRSGPGHSDAATNVSANTPDASADGASSAPQGAGSEVVAADARETAEFDWTLAILVAGCAAAVAGTVWAWTRRARREQPTPNIIPFPEPRRGAHEIEGGQRFGLLDALINDELPLSEEPCRLPSGLQFYGRSPVARRHGVEPAQAEAVLSAPHFTTPEPAPAHHGDDEPDAAEEPERATVSLRVDAGHPAARPPHHAPRVGDNHDGRDLAGARTELPEERKASLLDRVLTHIHETGKNA